MRFDGRRTEGFRAATSTRTKGLGLVFLFALTALVVGARADPGDTQRRRLAVLELAHTGPLEDEALRVSSDLVRGAALKRLSRTAWQVMTRENMLAMLPPGTDLSACVGECEVETGRRLGAWLVVTGEVARMGPVLAVMLKAHRTDSSELVAQSMARTASTEGLLEAVPQAAEALFSQVAFLESGQTPLLIAEVSSAGTGAETKVAVAAPVADQAKEPSPRVREGPGPTDLNWISLPGGTFMMGSDVGASDEQPRRRVSVATFELMQAEVTLAQYRACVEAGGCTAAGTGGACNWGRMDRDTHPINCVNWEAASAFGRWAGGRLPSEAEWEYAARSGGRDVEYPWGGAEATCRRAMMNDGSGNGCGEGKTTAPVCSKPEGNSAQGVCDLAGNVWEWTEDWYGPYTEAPSNGSAQRVAGRRRLNRGGGWFGTVGYLRAANRGGSPGFRDDALGFRLAR